MKRADIIKLITLCSVNYRNWPEPDKAEALTSLWTDMLSDVDFEIAQMAVQKYMLESVYPPTVADIRSRVADFVAPKEKSGIEAWGEVKTAIRKFGYYREGEAMASLRGPVKEVVKSIGFQTLCMSDNEMADRAHFLKVYETIARRERDDALLLPGMRQALNQLQDGRRLLLEGEGA